MEQGLRADAPAVLGSIRLQHPDRISHPDLATGQDTAIARVVEAFAPLPPPMTAQLLRLCPLFFWFSSAKAEAELEYKAGPIGNAIRAAYHWMEEQGLVPVRPRPDKPEATA